MSMISESPNKSWSEEKIIELLDANMQAGSSASKEVRVVCLDELRKRKTINQVDRATEVLLEVARIRGRSTPESFMIVELISRLADLEETAFGKLYDKMNTYKDDNSLYCFARVTRNLRGKKKRKCVLRLLSLLMNCDSFTTVTDEMYQTIITVSDKNIIKETMEATIPYLESPDVFKVVYAVGITSRLASGFISDSGLVVERALNGWYDGHAERILKNICNYFGRIKDEKSIPYLLQMLEVDFHKGVISKALASVVDTHPQAITKLWEFLEKEKEHYPSILEAFAEMETSIDLERLFSVVNIDLSKWRPKEALKKIMVKAGERAKPLLFEMVRDKDQNRYSFALECLEEIGVSIEEYSEIFEKSPILQVYEFFYGKKPEMLLENLWKEQNKLGESIKRAQIKKFDYFIQNLFSALGFVTLFVDPSDKEGVDLVAFSPSEPYILIIGCTTGVVPDDLKKLNMTLDEMEDALEELLSKYRILPMVITSKRVEVSSADSEYAGKNNKAILTQEETTKLLDILRTNRTSEEIIKQIERSIPTPDSDNPYGY